MNNSPNLPLPPRVLRLNCLICCLSFSVIVAIVIGWPTLFSDDELRYLSTIPLLIENGLSEQFLRSLPGPAGPLFTVVQFIFSLLTGFQLPGIRLINPILFIPLVILIAQILRQRHQPWPWLLAPQLLAAPVLYILLGHALTEIPAMLCFYAHLFLLLQVVRDLEGKPSWRTGIWAAIAGLLFSLAVLGRQTFLLGIVPSLLWVWIYRRAWPLWLLYFGSAAILPGLVFSIWQGLLPPLIGAEYAGVVRSAFHVHGWSIDFGLFSFAYAAFVYTLYDLFWWGKYRNGLLGCVTFTLIANWAVGFMGETLPLKGFALLFPQPVVEFYGRTVGGLLAGLGLAFLAYLLLQLRGRNPYSLYLAAICLTLLIPPAQMTDSFTGRYIAIAVPALLLLAVENRRETPWQLAATIVGCAIGLFSLVSYYLLFS
uniref:Glycosyltransferase RgtA/B/C/D-like domain-containing protein n=1 Tax=Cyanothece sp. (strain PCC 7425 / ATCC 29141) TaxID=395961 RepID=B8HSQ8_CYAP4